MNSFHLVPAVAEWAERLLIVGREVVGLVVVGVGLDFQKGQLFWCQEAAIG